MFNINHDSSALSIKCYPKKQIIFQCLDKLIPNAALGEFCMIFLL